MKVTDEMVERAWDELDREPHRDYVRVALEAALADVPDPEDVRAEVMEGLAYGRSVERQALDARIAELEAKLEKVREWCENHLLERAFQDGLGAILDGEAEP